MKMMARLEADLMKTGERFLNQALEKIIPHRTLESIKGKRRDPKYKAYVAEFSNIQEPLAMPPLEIENRNNYSTKIITYINGLPEPKTMKSEYQQLRNICQNLDAWEEERILQETTIFIRKLLPIVQARRNDETPHDTVAPTKRKQRRIDYAKTQQLWNKNASLCLRTILKDAKTGNPPPVDLLWAYWRTVMTQGEAGAPQMAQEDKVHHEIWDPIAPQEIAKAFPANSTAPGPDGILARDLKKIPLEILSRIFNTFLLIGKTPEDLLESRTALIPKKDGAERPEDFRPITVSSVLIRTFHKILAMRMMKNIKLDERQKAFRKVDGCAENVFLLDLALRYHRASCKHVYVASLDVAKAFDSVSHEAIFAALKASGVPQSMISYMRFVYKKSCTRLYFNKDTSDKIRPTCGVKQGDPMSPVIFNCLINQLVRRIPDEIGTQIPGGPRLNILAFADDIVLIASTQQGLQQLINTSTQFLEKCSLKINTNKSHTIAIKNVPHDKRSVVDEKTTFNCLGRSLVALKRTDEWRYLGVKFSPSGTVRVNLKERLLEQLEKLTRAPLKPQQRLFGLRVTLLPSFYHLLMLGDTRLSQLKDCDKAVRNYVRRWACLPHDVPVAYIHSSINDGGLGIPSLRWSVPAMRLSRIRALVKTNDCSYLQQEIQKVKSRLDERGETYSSADEIRNRWSKLLYARIDGKALKGSANTPAQHNWVGEGTRFLSGKDYINLIKLRINALPVRARTTRGRRADRTCRGGCPCPETVNHVLQNCHRTHDMRLKRHDSITSYMERNLKNRKFTVHNEPHLKDRDELRKPDLVAVKDDKAYLIDAQVVGDQINADDAHQRKISYYRTLEPEIKRKYNVRNVEFTSITLTWRGLWSPKSCNQLLQWGFLKQKEIKIISTRALIGGYIAFKTFNKRTTIRRTGVG